jgi:hypothetical protein
MKITNQLILDAIYDYIQGENHSTRPFSNLIVDEYNNTIEKSQLELDPIGNVYYSTNYDGERKLVQIMDEKELAQNIINQFNRIVTLNDPKDITAEDIEAYKTVITK